MIRDLRTILDGWDFEPGKISVRKIIGRDGREKIQTRIDLGVLQLECMGRPDGHCPHGHESLLEYHEARLREHLDLHGDDEDFILSPEDARDLRHEAYLYYQRYLSAFVLEEYELVERDTARNLRVAELCARYAAREPDRNALHSQRAYVVMMHGRAKAYRAMQNEQYDAAIRFVEEGLTAIERIAAERDDDDGCLREIETLERLREEIVTQLPEDTPARLQADLEDALAREDYETAAQLRDRLSDLRPSSTGV